MCFELPGRGVEKKEGWGRQRDKEKDGGRREKREEKEKEEEERRKPPLEGRWTMGMCHGETASVWGTPLRT